MCHVWCHDGMPCLVWLYAIILLCLLHMTNTQPTSPHLTSANLTSANLTSMNRQQLSVLGAAVADAATLGFHWLYDQQRIRSLESQSPEFHQHKKADYKDVSGYFAHQARSCGQFSQYGEQLKAMLQSLIANDGKYEKSQYQSSFVETFGYGGSYVGYIDRPTRKTLDNIAQAGDGLDDAQFYGADDSQIPALSKLPALVAAYSNDDSLPQLVESAVRVTNNNDSAVEYAQFFTQLLTVAIQTGDIKQVIAASAKSNKYPLVAPLMEAVFEFADVSTPVATEKWGMACELNLGTPSIIHNLTTAADYAQGVQANIYAGGDSCGRSIFLGAILGACYGQDAANGIPVQWVDKVTDKAELIDGLAIYA